MLLWYAYFNFMDLKQIAGRFGLDVSRFDPVRHAVLSDVFICDEKYVLRSRTLETGVFERFKNEQNLLGEIRRIVPVKFPELLKTETGDNFITEQESLWTAYPFIPGEILCAWWNLEKLSEEKSKNTFLTLRELHENTRGKLVRIDIRNEYHFLDDVRERLADSGSEITERERARVKKAIEIVNRFEQNLQERDFCFVHGDYHPGNVIFNGDKIIGLLDTDWSRKGHCLEDLAYTLMMFLRNYQQQQFHFDFENYSKFLGWYGIQESDIPMFREYFILYTFYDTHLFRDLEQLPNRDRVFEFQKRFLEDACQRF